MVERVGRLLQSIAERNVSILLVEQKLTIAMQISHRVYVMGHGRIVFEGTRGTGNTCSLRGLPILTQLGHRQSALLSEMGSADVRSGPAHFGGNPFRP